MAKIDGFTKTTGTKTQRMSKLQCDECGFEWVCAEDAMKRLQLIYVGKHFCNTCVSKKTKASWKK
jgi:hypothetical protein